MQLVRLVDLFQLAVAPILQQSFPDQVGFALHDGVGMLEGLFGLQRRMKAAHHDWDAALAELVTELVRAQRRADRGGHPDQVPAAVKVEFFKALVAERHLVVVGRQPGNQGNHQAHDEPPTGLMGRAVEMDSGRLNQ